MTKLTFDDIMDLKPCYPADEVEAFVGDGLTLIEILELPISRPDRLWFAFQLLTLEDASRFMSCCCQHDWSIDNRAQIYNASNAYASDLAWRLWDVEGNTRSYNELYNEELQSQIDWLKKEMR